MLSYWRTWPGRLSIQLTFRRVEGALGSCADDGFTLRFLPVLDWPDLYPPDKAGAVIAHELAHAYRHAALPVEQLVSESVERCEVETRELAESWGFPQAPFRRRDYKEALALEAAIVAVRATAGQRQRRGGAGKIGRAGRRD
jgi:hypothetical protein